MSYRRRSHRLGNPLFSLVSSGVLAGAVLALAAPAAAQQFRFPSRAAGTSGFVTDVLTVHELNAQYNFWETTFIERCNTQPPPATGRCQTCDTRMVYRESGNDTRSEGIGYGMVIAAYFGKQATFDGLWNYYQRTSDGTTGLMHWRRDGCGGGGGGGDTGSASDADIDAAFGLIVADAQWPGQGYAADAASITGAIRTRLFQGGCQGLLLAGSTFLGCGCINPSYIPPGYYPAFGQVENQAAFWNTARTNSYTYFNNASNNQTGLVPAWSQSNGATPEQCPGAPQVSGGGNTNEFQADAARTPWRVATDYLWSGNASAASFLQAIAGFATSRPIVHIVDRYSLAGNALNGNAGGVLDATGFRSSFTMGGFATAMMASSQEDVDRFTGAWQSLYVPGDNIGPTGAEPRAFGSSLALLYGLTVTGFMWNPMGPDPVFLNPPALTPAGTNQLENGDFEEGVLNWSVANLNDAATPGTRAEGFAMHRDGELQIEVQRTAARAMDPWEVRLAQTVSVQAGQKYRISVRARASAPRPLKISVESGDGQAYAFYGGLINRRGPGAVTLSTDMVEYDTVFTAAATNANARFDIDVADSNVTLVIDDVIFEPTDLPVTVAGDLIGVPIPPDPDNPPDPNNPDPGNPPDPNNPDLGSLPGTGDNTGVPGGIGENGGLPAPPAAGLPPGVGATCTTDADCGGDPTQARCSTVLSLCYEMKFGYVWDAVNARWSTPPSTPACGPMYVYWPLVNGCYDPETGWAYNDAEARWVLVGDKYTKGQDGASGASDSACAVVHGVAGAPRSDGWLFAGAIAALLAGIARRRRSAR